MKIKGLHFIITGGTIDSVYDGAKDTVVTSKKSIVPSFIGSVNLGYKTKFTQAAMKDSRNLQEKDLKKVLSLIKQSPYDKIIVTHGTYTMPDTARFLKAQLKKLKKTVVVTGSMIPILGFTPSDGTFNLGYAIGRIESLPHGIYVAMNGRIFSPEEVLKNLYSGTFTSIFGEK